MVFIAWDGDQLVGLVRAIDDSVLPAYMHCALIPPDYQGHGIDGQDKIGDTAKEHGIAIMDFREEFPKASERPLRRLAGGIGQVVLIKFFIVVPILIECCTYNLMVFIILHPFHL